MMKDGEYFTEEEFNFAYSNIYKSLLADQTIKRQKSAFILGGQPGSGKSVFYKNNFEFQKYILINGDDYRKQHPHFEDIAQKDIQNMSQRTQSFCNAIVEKLIEELSNKEYNIIVEGTLRNPEVSIKTSKYLASKGYETNLVIVACDAEMAWKSTLMRAEHMKNFDEYPRYVPIDIFNIAVNNIVDNLEIICNERCFDTITIMNRKGECIYPNVNGLMPSEVLRQVINIDNWNSKFKIFEKEFFELKKIMSKEHCKEIKRPISKRISIKEKLSEMKEKSEQPSSKKEKVSEVSKKKQEISI